MTFMDLQEPHYAYMFGFLQADGHMSQGTRNRGCVTVEINFRDVQLLEQFKAHCPYNSTISERTRKTNFSESHRSAIWSLFAREARERLADLGLPYGRKSELIKPPEVSFSRRDWLRGIIDADGSVGFTGSGRPFVSLATKSLAVAEFATRYAEALTGTARSLKPNNRDQIYNIFYMNEPAAELAGHLYDAASLALERKRRAALKVDQWQRPEGSRRGFRRTWSSEEDEILLSAASPEVAALVLKRTPSSCKNRYFRIKPRLVHAPA